MWNDYFTRANIVGVDYFRAQVALLRKANPGLARPLHNDLARGHNFTDQVFRGELGPRVSLKDVNQSDWGEMQAMAASLRGGDLFDLIIEDGSHLHRDQQLALAVLLPLVRPGGTYVVEDISTSFHWAPGYDEMPRTKGTTYKVLEAFNASGRLRSKHLTSEHTDYLERWIDSVESFVTGRLKWDVTCIVRKRLEPLGSAAERPTGGPRWPPR